LGKEKPDKKRPREYEPYVIPQVDTSNVLQSHQKIIMFYHINTQHTKTTASRAVDRNWFNQPRIFRRYYLSPYSALPIPTASPQKAISYNSLFNEHIPPQIIDEVSLSEFLFYALSISGCREPWELASMPRSAWSKRVNPSR
jgi:hypothetical protein